MDNPDELQKTLKKWVDSEGIELLNNNMRLKGILADECPKLVNKRKKIMIALDNNVASMFYKIAITRDDEDNDIYLIRDKLTNEVFLSSEVIDYIIQTFSYAISLNNVGDIQKLANGVDSSAQDTKVNIEGKEVIEEDANVNDDAKDIITEDSKELEVITPKINKAIFIVIAIFLETFGIASFYLNRKLEGVICILLCWTGLPSWYGIFLAIYFAFVPNNKIEKKYGIELIKYGGKKTL